MADNPVPPLPRDTPVGLAQWMNKVLVPRITKENAIKWNQLEKAGSSVGDLETQESDATSSHIATTEAHGSNGTIVGADDITDVVRDVDIEDVIRDDDEATTTVAGIVRMADIVANLGSSAISPSATYDQGEAISVANLAKNTSDKVDELLAALRSAGTLES